MARSDQTAFRVRPLEGPFSGQNIDLIGRQLPYRAGGGGNISFGREQRTRLTWYPGNRVASQQVIGPVLKPTTINGVWKERFLGVDQPITLVELFEELCNTGVQVRVSWQTIVRIGIVKRVEWAPGDPTGGLTDIRWTIEFEWVSEDVGGTIRRINQNELQLRDVLIQCANQLLRLGGALDLFAQGVDSFVGLLSQPFRSTATQLSTLEEERESQFGVLSQAAVDSGTEVQIPSRIAQPAVSAAEGSQSNVAETSDVVAKIFPSTTTADDSLESILNQAIDRYNVIDESTTALRLAFEVRLRFEPLIRPDEFTVVAANPGTDLRRVAIQFYGDADAWPRIARFNGIEGSVIPEDVDDLVIPLSVPDALDPRENC